jgi:hypothetical protein
VPVEHRIYATRSAKIAAIVTDASTLLGSGSSVVAVAHFRASFSQVQVAFTSAGLNAFLCQTTFDQGDLTSAVSAEIPSLGLAMADPVPSLSFEPLIARRVPPLAWLVAEHHPLQSGDDAILPVVQSLEGRHTVVFYDSLDSALLNRYGGKEVQRLFAMLGLGEDQYVSHPMVANTIRNAQKGISRKATSPLSAHSAEAWFQQNLP